MCIYTYMGACVFYTTEYKDHNAEDRKSHRFMRMDLSADKLHFLVYTF